MTCCVLCTHFYSQQDAFGDPLALLIPSATCIRGKVRIRTMNLWCELGCFTGAVLIHTSQPWRTEWTAGQLCCWRLMTSFSRLLTGQHCHSIQNNWISTPSQVTCTTVSSYYAVMTKTSTYSMEHKSLYLYMFIWSDLSEQIDIRITFCEASKLYFVWGAH